MAACYSIQLKHHEYECVHSRVWQTLWRGPINHHQTGNAAMRDRDAAEPSKLADRGHHEHSQRECTACFRLEADPNDPRPWLKIK